MSETTPTTAVEPPAPHDQRLGAALSPRPENSSIQDDGKLPPYFSLLFSTRAISLAVSTIVLMQLTFYATNVVGLSPALIGGLFLASKIIDAFTDLGVGLLIDRTKTRWGKARPYELFIIPLWVLTIAIFATPEMSTFWQATYLFLMYTLINAVCVTALYGSEAVYLKRAVTGEVRYAKVLSRQSMFIILVAGVAQVLLPQLIGLWGGQPGGWTLIAVVYGVPMMAIGLIRFFTIKETAVDAHEGVDDQPSIREILAAVSKNKYAFLLAVIVLAANILVHSGSIVATYYFTYVLGDVGLMSLVSLGTVVLPFTFLLFPLAVRRIGAINFVRIGLVLAIVGYGMVFLFPRELAVVVTGQILGSGASIITMLVGFFVIQTMVYGEWRTGKRIEAATNSVVGFSGKVGAGLAPAVVGMILAAAGYDGLASQQNATSEAAIISLYSVVPMLLSALILALTYFYRLDKHIGAVNKDLAEGIHADTSDLKL